jgi:ABC-type Mn2+/Zn2+ transport system permease subunit
VSQVLSLSKHALVHGALAGVSVGVVFEYHAFVYQGYLATAVFGHVNTVEVTDRELVVVELEGAGH